MVFWKEGISEDTIERGTIHAKESTNLAATVNHSKVTGTNIPSKLKFCLDVCLANIDSSTPLPVEDAGDRNEFFIDATVVSDGTVQTAISYVVPVVPVGLTFRLNNLVASSNTQILCRILKGATLIGTTRSGAANKQATFKWEPNRTLAAGDTVTVTVEDITGGPGFGNNIDVFLQGRQF